MSIKLPWRNWLEALRGLTSNSAPACKPQRRSPARPCLEALEDRMLPSANLPYANPTTAAQLVADINQANLNGGPNTITLSANVQLTAANNIDMADGANGLPVIAAGDQLTLVGNGYTIARSSTAAFRLLTVAQGASLTLENVTLTGGLAQGSGAAAEGGAIYNQGMLTLQNVKVTNNTAQGSNGSNGTTLRAPSAGQAAAGGGIYSGGAALTLEAGTLIENNQAIGGNGGSDNYYYEGDWGGSGGNALGGGFDAAGGTVRMTNATLSGNKAQGGNGAMLSSGWGSGTGGFAAGGGAYVATGTANMSGDIVSSNQAQAGSGTDGSSLMSINPGDASGGGLYVATGTLTLTNSKLTNDRVQGGSALPNGSVSQDGGSAEGGGAFVQVGNASLSNDTLANDTAQGGNGANAVDTSDDIYSGGSALGGGLAASSGDVEGQISTLTLRNDTLNNDHAQGGNGGNNGGDGAYAEGGGVATMGATGTLSLSMINDTLASNIAQGGNGGNGGLGGDANGGGASLDATVGESSLINDTLAYNRALAGNGGNTYPPQQTAGGGLYILGTTSLTNTLVAGNTAAAGPDVYGPPITSDHNLIGNTSGSSGFSASHGDILNPASAGIGTLANNGGATQTIALLSGSAALNAGDSSSTVLKSLETAEGVYSTSALTDQRGSPRLAGTSIDIGAYEHATASATANVSVSGQAPSQASAGGQITYTLIVSNKSATAQNNVTLTDLLPANTTLVKWTPASGWKGSAPAAGSSGTVTATGNLAANASATFTLVVQVSKSAAGGTVLSNTASLKPLTGETNTGTTSVASKTTVAGVNVSRGGFSANAALHEMMQTVTITNLSSTPLTGPLAVLVYGLPSGVSVANATATYGGYPYVDFVAAGHSLAAKQSASVTLVFKDPQNVPITYTTEVWQDI